jgi:hypothetical protein
LSTHLSGFPVSGSQGMGNRETVSKYLNLIRLPFPDEAARPTPVGKPLGSRAAQDSESARQNRGLGARLMLLRTAAMVSSTEGRADLPA